MIVGVLALGTEIFSTLSKFSYFDRSSRRKARQSGHTFDSEPFAWRREGEKAILPSAALQVREPGDDAHLRWNRRNSIGLVFIYLLSHRRAPQSYTPLLYIG